MQVQTETKPYDTINVTPMLDLAYVLLVVFILMTTASVQGLSMSPAQAEQQAEHREEARAARSCRSRPRADVLLNGASVSPAELEAMLAAAKARDPEDVGADQGRSADAVPARDGCRRSVQPGAGQHGLGDGEDRNLRCQGWRKKRSSRRRGSCGPSAPASPSCCWRWVPASCGSAAALSTPSRAAATADGEDPRSCPIRRHRRHRRRRKTSVRSHPRKPEGGQGRATETEQRRRSRPEQLKMEGQGSDDGLAGLAAGTVSQEYAGQKIGGDGTLGGASNRMQFSVFHQCSAASPAGGAGAQPQAA